MKKLLGLFALIAAMLAPTGAFATSTCPTFYYGLVPTAAQWQACFDAKQNSLGYTAVNKAGDTMTGTLVVPGFQVNADSTTFLGNQTLEWWSGYPSNSEYVFIGNGIPSIINSVRYNGGGVNGAAFIGTTSAATSYSTSVHGALSNGNVITSFVGDGDDGTNFTTKAAALRILVSGTVSAGVIPGEFDFYTANAAGTLTRALKIGPKQHISTYGTIPTVSACGTGSPAVTTGSTDVAGEVTSGSGSSTACTITFGNTYDSAPFCTVSPETSSAGSTRISAISSSAFTMTYSAGTSQKFMWSCFGHDS